MPEGLKLAHYDKYIKDYGEKVEVKSSGNGSGLASYAKNHKDNTIGWEVI